MDTVDKKTRSRIMASVGQKGTKPEMILRRELHRMGFRYLVNDKRLPGSPDLVFPKYHAAIFVHGCFWHRHGCKYSTVPETRREFWEEKFLANRTRDRRKLSNLRKSGLRVKVVWECWLRGDKRKIQTCVSRLSNWLLNEKGTTLILR
jgi:DNA mismatch endonuclease (patch repair protein)